MNWSINSYKLWVGISLMIYVGLTILAVLVSFIGGFLFMDTDFVEITANILSTTQGLFNGLFGHGDFFEYSGFHIDSFIAGGLLWMFAAFLLYRISRVKKTTSEKLSYSGKILMITGLFVFGVSLLATLVTMLSDPFAILLLVFSAVLYVPLLLGGIIFKVISRYY